MLVFIIGSSIRPYIGRIIRGQALSLREREFVDAACSLGARRPYLLMTEMLPNLVASILVYATLLIPTNILFEAALSFLGVGIRRRPRPRGGHALRRGGLLHDAVPPPGARYRDPHLLAFNLFGDGLRTRLDPRAR